MPRTPGSNSKTLPREVDKVLLNHLLSAKRYESLSVLDGLIDYDCGKFSRKQVRNRLSYLRALKQNQIEDFIELCLLYKVTVDIESVVRGEQQNKADKPVEEKEEEEETEFSFITPEKRTSATKRTIDAVDPCKDITNQLSNMTVSIPHGAEIIHASTEFARFHRDIAVVPTKDIPGIDGKSYYDGFLLLVKFDVQYLYDNPNEEMLEAHLISSDNVLLKVPAAPYTLMFEQTNFDADCPDFVKAAIQNARHVYMDNKEEWQYKYYVIQFPHGVELNIHKINSAPSEDFKMGLSLIECETENRSFGFSQTDRYALWQVARTDTRASKRGNVDGKRQESSLLTLLKSKNSDQKMMGSPSLAAASFKNEHQPPPPPVVNYPPESPADEALPPSPAMSICSTGSFDFFPDQVESGADKQNDGDLFSRIDEAHYATRKILDEGAALVHSTNDVDEDMPPAEKEAGIKRKARAESTLFNLLQQRTEGPESKKKPNKYNP
eukprot:scaffold7476_cov68-Cylindrotheca_fusiformis.AAC.2